MVAHCEETHQKRIVTNLSLPLFSGPLSEKKLFSRIYLDLGISFSGENQNVFSFYWIFTTVLTIVYWTNNGEVQGAEYSYR